MALRATNGPAPLAKSAKVGQPVAFEAKVENTGAAEETISLAVEELKEGALAKPVEFAFTFAPSTVTVRAKGRERVAFSWVASLPAGKTAFTFRGKLVLRRADGAVVASVPLDLYVSS